MRRYRHWNSSLFYVIGEGLQEEPAYLKFSPPPFSTSAAATKTARTQKPQPIGTFGRLFPDMPGIKQKSRNDMGIVDKLVLLGQNMNVPSSNPHAPAQQSTIPSGYTYLGQFIAHEVSFDKTKAPIVDDSMPEGYRSPQIDLDSLYGLGPRKERRLYQDCARLKVGETVAEGYVKETLLNDLPRAGYGRKHPTKALIADPRNDDNLATAQMHVALARFHNRVVDALQRHSTFLPGCPELGHAEGCPHPKLFECARREVVQHFQSIILSDFLPRILDEKVMTLIRNRDLRYYDLKQPVFMPLEFSVAGFRFGHSMVRSSYEWNHFRCSEDFQLGAPQLDQLFRFTRFSGDMGGAARLKSDWVIDWRRFFDGFEKVGFTPDGRKTNFARKIDTVFNLHLDKILKHPHIGFTPDRSSITVRNLLRGYSLGLPTGEEVAGYIGETPIPHKHIGTGIQKEILSDPVFYEKTPLWYYVLREAELNTGANAGKLGPVASCIVGNTLLALIMQSPFSILKDPAWRPRFGMRAKNKNTKEFAMIDLLEFAGVVDPVGERVGTS